MLYNQAGTSKTKKKPLKISTPQTTKWKKTICAPYVIKKPKDYSCFSLEGLRKIAYAWNKKYAQKNEINKEINKEGYENNKEINKEGYENNKEINKEGYEINKEGMINYELMDRKTLWMEIKKKFDGRCYNEVCWVNQPEIKKVYDPEKTKELDVFRPVKPTSWDADDDKWLSSVDIKEVMDQYMEAYKNFIFIGPVPIDFDDKDGFGNCISNELCKIDLNAMIKKKLWYIGIIFNLDEHDEPGSHWVALFCNIKNSPCEISYWDSVADEPTAEVKKLMKRLKQQCIGLGHKTKININKIQHQYKNTECGVYCLNFIIQMLRGTPFKNVVQNIIDDDDMNKRRDLFFSNPRLKVS